MLTKRFKRNVILYGGKIIIGSIQYICIYLNGFSFLNIGSFVILHVLYEDAVRDYYDGSIYVEENFLKKK